MVATRPAPVNGMRGVELIAPDLEHVAEVFATPVVMTSDHFAVITEHDEADFDPATELGRYVTVMGVGDEPATLSHTRFVTAPSLWWSAPTDPQNRDSSSLSAPIPA